MYLVRPFIGMSSCSSQRIFRPQGFAVSKDLPSPKKVGTEKGRTGKKGWNGKGFEMKKIGDGKSLRTERKRMVKEKGWVWERVGM